jgi:hypothetical protein
MLFGAAILPNERLHRCRPAGDVEALVDPVQVGAHRALREVQPTGDLCVGVAVRHEPEDVSLPWCQVCPRVTLDPGPGVRGLQVGSQELEDEPLPLVEVPARAAEEEHAQGATGPSGQTTIVSCR